jgi:hypothetical protein
MNLEQLKKKNQGSAVYLRPVPGRFQTATQEVLPPIDDPWTIGKVEDGKVELHNPRTMHFVALGSDNIREFRTPNFLMLRCQLTLTEEHVLIEPLVGGGGGPTRSPPPIQDLPALAPERPTIREKSAAEILSNLNGTTLDYQSTPPSSTWTGSTSDGSMGLPRSSSPVVQPHLILPRRSLALHDSRDDQQAPATQKHRVVRLGGRRREYTSPSPCRPCRCPTRVTCHRSRTSRSTRRSGSSLIARPR